MKLKKYTYEQLVHAIQTSISYREVLIALNVIPAGGNYKTLKKAIDYFSLDISHFKHKGHFKGKSLGSRDIQDYFSNKQTITSHKLRLKLLSEGIFKHQCSNCSLSIWLGQPIPLELDHINGIHSDNSLSNLRLLCPNCHSLTPTFRGKKRKKSLA